jgi:hypothetical protein
MSLADGYQVENPPIFVPWHVSEAQLGVILPEARRITAGYLTADVVSLGGLAHVLGFHFEPGVEGRLVELELFLRAGTGLAATYATFQHHLELAFGPPTASRPGDEGFAEHRWDLAGVGVLHLVRERFGPEEIVRIRRL